MDNPEIGFFAGTESKSSREMGIVIFKMKAVPAISFFEKGRFLIFLQAYAQ